MPDGPRITTRGPQVGPQRPANPMQSFQQMPTWGKVLAIMDPKGYMNTWQKMYGPAAQREERKLGILERGMQVEEKREKRLGLATRAKQQMMQAMRSVDVSNISNAQGIFNTLVDIAKAHPEETKEWTPKLAREFSESWSPLKILKPNDLFKYQDPETGSTSYLTIGVGPDGRATATPVRDLEGNELTEIDPESPLSVLNAYEIWTKAIADAENRHGVGHELPEGLKKARDREVALLGRKGENLASLKYEIAMDLVENPRKIAKLTAGQRQIYVGLGILPDVKATEVTNEDLVKLYLSMLERQRRANFGRPPDRGTWQKGELQLETMALDAMVKVAKKRGVDVKLTRQMADAYTYRAARELGYLKKGKYDPSRLSEKQLKKVEDKVRELIKKAGW